MLGYIPGFVIFTQHWNILTDRKITLQGQVLAFDTTYTAIMKLEIEITRQDYVDFNTFIFFKTRVWRTVLTGIIGLVVMQVLINLSRTHIDMGGLIVSSAFYIAAYCFLIYRGLLKAKKAPQADGSILGHKVVEFTEDGISAKDKDSQSQYNWSAIKSIEESKKAFYLFIDTNMAMVIPKRSFENEFERQSFTDFSKKKINRG